MWITAHEGERPRARSHALVVPIHVRLCAEPCRAVLNKQANTDEHAWSNKAPSQRAPAALLFFLSSPVQAATTR